MRDASAGCMPALAADYLSIVVVPLVGGLQPHNCRIGLVAHQACPQHPVELRRGHLVGFGEVEAGGDLVPVRSVVLRLDVRAGGELNAVASRGASASVVVASTVDASAVYVHWPEEWMSNTSRHRPLEGGVQVDVLRAEDVLDRAQRVDLAVARADDRALLHVRSDDVGRAAMRIDVVRTVLHVVFGDDDQRVGGVAAVRDRLDQPAQREVAVGLLRFRRVHAAERGAETAHVVVADANQRQARQVAVGDELVELPLPLVVAPQVRIVLVVAAEVDVGQRRQRRVERRDLDDAGGERIGHRRGLRADAADVVHQEAVVADGSAGLQHGVEDVAVLDAERRVGGRVVAGSGQQVRGAAGQAAEAVL